MKFKLDENLPVEASIILRAAGFDVETIWDEQMAGASDGEVAQVCRQEDRVLITLDWHFSDIRNYPPREYPGIIILHLPQQDKETACAFIKRIPALLAQELVTGKLWIIEEKRLRIRS